MYLILYRMEDDLSRGPTNLLYIYNNMHNINEPFTHLSSYIYIHTHIYSRRQVNI